MNNTEIKIGLAGLLLVIGYIFTSAPRYAIHFDKNVFSLGNMMASGVLLGAGLVHQMPDAQESLAEFEYPWAGFICGVSFCFFLILEEIVHILFQDCGGHGHKHGVEEIDRTSFSCEPLLVANNSSDFSKNDSYKSIEDNTTETHNNCTHNHPNSSDNIFTSEYEVTQIAHQQYRRDSTISQSEHHHHQQHVEQHLHGSILSSITLLLALSVHALLAGFGLGLDNSPGMFGTAVAIIAHKIFAAYALGSTLTAADARYFYLVVSIFAFSTPVGIVAALVVGEVLRIDGVALGVIQSIVAGTFLYVAIVEVGTKELLACRIQTEESLLGRGRRMEMAKLLALLLGYGAMSVLALYF